ncbi:MAG: glutathione S-transferase family protein [Rhizobacter sp.]|nr:glutathione S-transferase family protein [Bacteriovorax sp.]
MVKLFHSPSSRSTGILWLLEELEIPYEVDLINIRSPNGAPEGYREIQPNKKVPAIIHDGSIITERAAIVIYLCDIFNDMNLAPQNGDLRRGQYLSMLVYCDSVMDPVMNAKMHGWTYRPSDFSYGHFDDMVKYIDKKLSSQLYAVGNEFTAADTQLGSAIHWGINILDVLPKKSSFMNYLSRIMLRPGFIRAMEKDDAFTRRPYSDPHLFNYRPNVATQYETSTLNDFYGDGLP